MAETVQIQEPELFWLLIHSVRYSMGRMSMAPLVTQDSVRAHGHALARRQLSQIACEIREKLKRCDDNWDADSAPLSDAERERHDAAIFGGSPLRTPATERNRPGRHWLGEECDHRLWQALAEWCEQQLEVVNG